MRRQVQEWVQLRIVEEVEDKPSCITPLILIPSQGKPRFKIYHDLRMLNATRVKGWGVSMDRMTKLQGLQVGKMFSTFDLSKGFIHISIHLKDRKYFGFYFAGKFYALNKLLFGFVNSIPHFKMALDHSLLVIRKQLEERGLSRGGSSWIMRYVHNALISSSAI